MRWSGVFLPSREQLYVNCLVTFPPGSVCWGGHDVTEHMSATPASNDDTLIRGSLESDLTLD